MSDSDEQQLWEISQPQTYQNGGEEDGTSWDGLGRADDSFVQGSSEQFSFSEIDSPTPIRTAPPTLLTGRTSRYFQNNGQSSNVTQPVFTPPRTTIANHQHRMDDHREDNNHQPTRKYSPPPIEAIDDDEPTATPEVMEQREASRKQTDEYVNVSELLNDQQRQCFPSFKHFNRVQSAVFEDAYKKDDNLVVSAPTGSGKTTIFELAFLKIMSTNYGDARPLSIYIAPTKALCSERQRDWQARMHTCLEIDCMSITGDTADFDLACRLIRKADIVVFTPEKLDSMTRHEKWAKTEFYNRLKLIMIDEVHILREDRGATLEVVISRMRQSTSDVRIVALSATIPNIDDIARWVGQREAADPFVLSSGVYRGGEGEGGEENSVGKKKVLLMSKAKVYQFGEEYRPVKLVRKVYGIECSSEWVLDAKLDAALFPILTAHAQGKPVLVFCATRKACQKTAEMVYNLYQESQAKSLVLPWKLESKHDLKFEDDKLSRYADCGIAIHHAGLSFPDRRSIEEGFIGGRLKMIVSTSTLAVGVNLPAHTVIIRGTTAWHGPVIGFKEYSDIDIQQMMGRAGRPQYDQSGTVVVICEQSKVKKYESMLYSSTMLESTLHLNLKEHLNSEIALGTIDSLATAEAWLKKSFLYIRIQQNPSHYTAALQDDVVKSDNSSWEEYVTHYLQEALAKLVQPGFVVQTPKGDPGEFKLEATQIGQILRRSMISYSTMLDIMSITEESTLRDLLEIVSHAHEFRDLRVRPGDAKLLNALREHDQTRYKIHRQVKEYWEKVFLLMQAQFGNIPYEAEKKTETTSPLQTQMMIFPQAQRIASAIVQVAYVRQYGEPLRAAMELSRTITAKAWEDTAVIFRQIDQIGPVAIRALEANHINTFDQLLAADLPMLIEKLNKSHKVVREIKEKVKTMPRFKVTMQNGRIESGKPPCLKIDVITELLAANMLEGLQRKNGRKAKPWSWNFSMVFLRDDGSYISYQKKSLKRLLSKKDNNFTVSVELSRRCDKVICHYGVEEIAGCSSKVEYLTDLKDEDYPKQVLEPSPPPAEVSPEVGPTASEVIVDHVPATATKAIKGIEDLNPKASTRTTTATDSPKRTKRSNATRPIDSSPIMYSHSPSPVSEPRLGGTKPPRNRKRELTPDEAYEMVPDESDSEGDEHNTKSNNKDPPTSSELAGSTTLDWDGDAKEMLEDALIVDDSSSVKMEDCETENETAGVIENKGDMSAQDGNFYYDWNGFDNNANFQGYNGYPDGTSSVAQDQSIPLEHDTYDGYNENERYHNNENETYRTPYEPMDQPAHSGYKRSFENEPSGFPSGSFDSDPLPPPAPKRAKKVTFNNQDEYSFFDPSKPHAGSSYQDMYANDINNDDYIDDGTTLDQTQGQAQEDDTWPEDRLEYDEEYEDMGY
ncbi:hypothetical protein I302_105607 [Kwoniella bestiolae CBS 10118]|uniref:DNA 3'-5' helicase n=1 Tax=Kwoniella bestiolae CBS 10118 TaxID=1296100 RepID=A0AAJ8K9N1_9TREE